VGTAWFSRRAVFLHLTALIVVPGCLALGWWQLHRALSGNELSWAYTFEWPLFAIYGVYMWWRILHEQEGSGDTTDPGEPATANTGRFEEAEDAELASYNRYLAALHAADEQKSEKR
jgi:DNA-binding transcriptional regulator of glucitol operon